MNRIRFSTWEENQIIHGIKSGNWQKLKDNWPRVRIIADKYIDDNYDRELAQYMETYINVNETSLMNLRGRGNHQLIDDIINLYDEEDYRFDSIIVGAYSSGNVLENLVSDGHTGGIIANRPEIYNHYKDYLILEDESFEILILHGYPEVMREQEIETNESDIKICIGRLWGQPEMMEEIIKKYSGPKIIEINDFKSLEIETVEVLLNYGYELKANVWKLLSSKPEIFKFMMDNYEMIDLRSKLKNSLNYLRRGRMITLDILPENREFIINILNS